LIQSRWQAIGQVDQVDFVSITYKSGDWKSTIELEGFSNSLIFGKKVSLQ